MSPLPVYGREFNRAKILQTAAGQSLLFDVSVSAYLAEAASSAADKFNWCTAHCLRCFQLPDQLPPDFNFRGGLTKAPAQSETCRLATRSPPSTERNIVCLPPVARSAVQSLLLYICLSAEVFITSLCRLKVDKLKVRWGQSNLFQLQ